MTLQEGQARSDKECAKAPLNVQALRAEFPILARRIDGMPLVYLDNAATTQKPQCVIDAIVDYYTTCNANVHRGAHRLADEATQAYENARDIVASFINAASRRELLWTSGTTGGINLVAHGLAERLRENDEVLVTEMEHHANLVTWQQACKRAGAKLVIAPIFDNGELDMEGFAKRLNERTQLVAVPHVSNALGTLNPIAEISRMARTHDALVLIDGAQGIAHEPVDVQALDCDFYAFSGHKLFGPTGIGALWGREAVLADWPVWQTGGEMIASVSYQDASWGELPSRFEAGTPDIAGAIAMGRAVQWFSDLDMAAVMAHERALIEHATRQAEDFEGLRIVGSAPNKVAVLSFVMDQGHPADVGFLLDRQGIAIRTGHHCAEPLMARLAVPGTARASFALYNTLEEVDALFTALRKVKSMLG